MRWRTGHNRVKRRRERMRQFYWTVVMLRAMIVEAVFREVEDEMLWGTNCKAS